jgi:hypothetical protein
MAVEKSFRYVIVLPLVDDIHGSLMAFFATSEHGEWRVDAQAPSTPFALHFIRGNWKRAWLGLSDTLTPGPCGFDARGHNRPDTRPMRLKITARPSPVDIRLSLQFSAFSLVAYSHDVNKQYVAYWAERTEREAQDLGKYLRVCYELPEPLSLGSEQPGGGSGAAKA